MKIPSQKKVLTLCSLFIWLLGISSVQAASPIVVITENGFIPATLHLKKGEKVQLVISNKADGMHRFTLPDLNLQTSFLQEGAMTTLSFQATQAGTYTYYAPPSAWKGKLIIK